MTTMGMLLRRAASRAIRFSRWMSLNPSMNPAITLVLPWSTMCSRQSSKEMTASLPEETKSDIPSPFFSIFVAMTSLEAPLWPMMPMLPGTRSPSMDPPGERAGAADDVQEPEAVGAQERHVLGAAEIGELFLQPCPFALDLGKSRRDEKDVFDAARRQGAHGIGHQRAPDDDRGEIDDPPGGPPTEATAGMPQTSDAPGFTG